MDVRTANVDDICCAYCGLKEKQYLAYCGTDNCMRWFCNGTFGNDKSHIVAHCCKSKHNAVSIFRGIPPGTNRMKSTSMEWILKECTYQPQCWQCSSNNVFDLAVEDVSNPFIPAKTWCRKHAVSSDKVGKDLWNTLIAIHPEKDYSGVAFHRLAAWLVPVVPKKVMQTNVPVFYARWGQTASEKDVIDFLEEFWRWNPAGTMDELEQWKVAIGNFTAHPKTEFDDGPEYSNYWQTLIAELSRQERGAVESFPPLRDLEVTWQNNSDIQMTVPQGILTDFLEVGRPMQVAWVVVDKGAERDVDRQDATISFMKPIDTGHLIVLHCKKPVADRDRINRGLQFRTVYNEASYRRMNQALVKLEHDPMCISPEVMEVILGRRPINLAASQTEEKEENTQSKTTLPVTMNTNPTHAKLQPFHTEYVDTGSRFRNFRFQTILAPQRIEPLNEKQKLAVNMALNMPVCLIQGPPGTGKTKTAAVIVANFAQDLHGKILVCAPSNVAVDNVTLMIAQAAQLSKSFNILRLLAHNRDVKCLNEKVREYTVFRKYKKEHPEAQETDDKTLREFERKCIEKAQIICCTCNSAGLACLEGVAFSYVLIDEAAQGMEPDCLIPITRACEKLVLIGDPEQLGSVVRFPNLRRSQLAVSLFQRLWEKKDVCPWITLTQQYRMNPKISEMVSKITYGDQLVNDPCVDNRPPISSTLQAIFAYGSTVARGPSNTSNEITNNRGNLQTVFVDLARNDQLSASGTSYVNMLEAHFIARLVANILHAGDVLGTEKTNSSDIGIITFYNGQRPQLEIDLKHHWLTSTCAKDIEIKSVDGFQGREKEIIILSCVLRQGRESLSTNL